MADALIDNGAFKPTPAHDGIGPILLQHGESAWSLAELAAECKSNERAVETARVFLRDAGLIEFYQVHPTRRAKTVYRVLEWWRFIEASRADENLSGTPSDNGAGTMLGQSNELKTLISVSVEAEERDNTGTIQGQYRDNVPRDDRARTNRAQSAEHTHPRTDAGVIACEDLPKPGDLNGYLAQFLGKPGSRNGTAAKQ